MQLVVLPSVACEGAGGANEKKLSGHAFAGQLRILAWIRSYVCALNPFDARYLSFGFISLIWMCCLI